jgi:hypothetical protein
MELPKQVKDEIWEYCRVNDIPNIDEFVIKMLKQGFTSEKFGSTPWDKPAEIVEKEIIKEVTVEVIKEVPVEVTKEVEVIVEKEVFVTDDEANKELQTKIKDLEGNIKKLKETKETIIKESSERGVKISELNLEISDLTSKISQLKEELEAEKAKPKQEEDKDIYGEGKRGIFGSNISDLWNKNKK